ELMYKDKLCRKVGVIRHLIWTNGNYSTEQMPQLYVYNNDDTVFVYSNVHDTFVPMYIFNVSVGDTLTYHVPDNLFYTLLDTFFQVIVDSVFDMEVNDVQLKTIRLIPSDSFDCCRFGKKTHHPSVSGAGQYSERIGVLKGSS